MEMLNRKESERYEFEVAEVRGIESHSYPDLLPTEGAHL